MQILVTEKSIMHFNVLLSKSVCIFYTSTSLKMLPAVLEQRCHVFRSLT